MYLSVLTSGNIFAILQKTNGIPHSLKLAKLPPKIKDVLNMTTFL